MYITSFSIAQFYIFGYVLVFFTLLCSHYLLGDGSGSHDKLFRIAIVSGVWPLVLPFAVIWIHFKKSRQIKNLQKDLDKYKDIV